jgi:Uma2 family endonuclease
MDRKSAKLIVVEPHSLRFTKADYIKMHDAGIFEQRRVELIDGEVIAMPAMGNEHAVVITKGTYLLPTLFGPAQTVRIQLPLDFGDSQPEPDFAVVAGGRQTIQKHPAHANLIIEVADRTLVFDQTRKAQLYASRKIPDYWIVNLIDDVLEVRRRPVANTSNPIGWTYGDKHVFTRGQTIAPLAFPRKKIKVADLLP